MIEIIGVISAVGMIIATIALLAVELSQLVSNLINKRKKK